jgi:hypothetical protein
MIVRASLMSSSESETGTTTETPEISADEE